MKIMNMKIFGFLMVFIPVIVAAQQSGIHFEKGLSIEQIFAKAKTEGKYIFVDCYTTWCGPCKNMDEVYKLPELGDSMKNRFVSIKLQMDTTFKDDLYTQKLYSYAHDIQNTYKVFSFPCYLFFSSDGNLLVKDIGSKNINEFTSMLSNAIDSNKQYYRMRKHYESGVIDLMHMKELAYMEKSIGESKRAHKVAQEYIKLLPLEKLCQGENILFCRDFTSSSQDFSFKLLYINTSKVDHKSGISDFVENIVCRIIEKEEIDTRLFNNIGVAKLKLPDWGKYRSIISKKYTSKYADRCIVDAKVKWYGSRSEWRQYCRSVIKKVDKYGPYGLINTVDWRFNALAWELFSYSNDDDILDKALHWSDSAMKISLNRNPAYIDTYANLLYKLHRVSEAILWEQKAADLDSSIIPIKSNLKKMRNGEETWPENR